MFRLFECLSALRFHSEQGGNSNDIYALTPVAWTKLIKSAWDKKIFLTNDSDFRKAAALTAFVAAERLARIYNKEIQDKNVETLEKTLVALSQSLINGCKLELPTD